MKILIITSQFVQDHEFIYPFYRLKEEGYDVHVYNQSENIVKGFWNKDSHKKMTVLNLESIDVDSYNALILPGGVNHGVIET